MPQPAPLPQVVGFRLSEWRRKAVLRQDDVATAAQRLGLPWRRSSVAMLEQGRRRLSAEELLLLPYVLDEAIRVANPGADIAFSVSLGELLAPGRRELLALTDVFGLTPEQVKAWLGTEPDVIQRRWGDEVSEAERHAARALEVSVEAIQEAARRLWGRTLSEERDARVAEDAGNTTPRSRQARRGLVTRALLAELAPFLKES